MPRSPARPAAALVGALLALAMSVVGTSTAWAVVPDEDAAERAAQEIQAAQDRANAAAGKFLEAESELEVRTDETWRLEAEHEALLAVVDALRDDVEAAAVDRFASAGSAGIPLLTDYRLPAERMQANALAAVVDEGAADSFDAYAQAQSDLEGKAAEVEAARKALAAQQETYDEARQQAEAEIVHLQEVERVRLADEQVRIALELQRREEEARRLVEEQRRAEELRLQEAQRQAEAQARDAAQRQADEARRADEAAQASAIAAVASAPEPQ
ncbi:MAG: hypothetical protein M3487_01405, partial [Actinomycetota bacterium]|nr:hypothetical protein [Actinomycetota bacterium]